MVLSFEKSDLIPCSSVKDEDLLFCDDDRLPDLQIKEIDEIDCEKRLTEFVWRDDKVRLVSLFKKIAEKALEKADLEETDGENLVEPLGSRLLHLACKLDSVECAAALIDGEAGIPAHINKMDGSGRTPLQNAAEMNSVRCIDLLLRKQARTDLRSKDENSLLAIEIALASKRLQVVWTPNDSVEELVVLLGQRIGNRRDHRKCSPRTAAMRGPTFLVAGTVNLMGRTVGGTVGKYFLVYPILLVFLQDLRGVEMLAEGTKDVAEVARVIAMDGKVAGLAALLIVSEEKVNAVLPLEVGSAARTEASLYEQVIREAISLGRMGDARLGSSSYKASSDSTRSSDCEMRKLLLCEMELLQLFGAVARGSCQNSRMTSPLISACQAGDEAVVKLLLKTNLDVNDTDWDGNSALHWCLKMSSCSQESRLRIVWLLVSHGARVYHKNMLGLTPLHVAAANGNSQALQIFLLRDPASVDMVSETKETPLFLAVKNESMECARLLLSFGANTQALNLRRERPVDLAKSQDMRFILSSTNNGFWNRASQMEENAGWSLITDESNADMFRGYLEAKEKATSLERFCANEKTELCRYFESPSGCVRGAKCYFAHGEAELRRAKVLGPPELKQGSLPQATARNVRKARGPEDLVRKIFVGGLPPSVDSAYLRQFFEREFGPVEDSTVIASQSGEHLQSRGFGFITFKHEDSAAAAVQAHYVAILGKKVEIKGAVPKVVFPFDLSKPPPRQQQLAQEQQHQQPFDPREKQPADDGRIDSMSWVEKLIFGSTHDQPNKNPTPATGPTGEASALPPWVATFRRWLPAFLVEVSKRLKEGECYPLSSLKGDFRATCGMELDHASLGHLKLSDFMRSFSGICKMRIVPVGRGPATHVVLLPSLHNTLPQLQKLPPPLLCDSEVPLKPDRSYAEHAPKTNNPNILQLIDHDEVEFGMLASPSYSADCGGDCSGFGGKGSAELSMDRFLSFLQTDRSFFTPWCTPSGRAEGREEDKQPRQQLSFADDKREDHPFSFFSRQWDYYENLRKNKLSEHAGKEGSINRQSQDRSSSNCLLCKEKKALWVNMPCGHKVLCGSCKSKHISSGTCMQCHTIVQCVLFAPWDTPRVRGQAPAEQNCSNKPCPSFSPSDQDCLQRSPLNTVPAFGCLKATSGAPTSDEEGSSLKGSSGGSGFTCVVCKERKAVWANVPCGHKVLCSACKSGQLMRSATCMICHSHVHNLISLYE
ncbi:uncharacterized protein LOC131254130 [Magnolia sinica]|uniref:uncharacterized protein LOC131254130 n=1 Tax=Magnolia sinica TaxID=86752 RepID=UPI00265B3E62|nr:uncharacterized protein LOC131254130 [Magnolia sinica]